MKKLFVWIDAHRVISISVMNSIVLCAAIVFAAFRADSQPAAAFAESSVANTLEDATLENGPADPEPTAKVGSKAPSSKPVTQRASAKPQRSRPSVNRIPTTRARPQKRSTRRQGTPTKTSLHDARERIQSNFNN